LAATNAKRGVKKPKPKKGYVSVQTGVGYSSGGDPYGAYYELDIDTEYGDMLVDDPSDFEDFSSAMPMPGSLSYGQQYLANPPYLLGPPQVRGHTVKSRKEKTKTQDQLLINTLKLLTTFLPSPHSPTGPVEEIRLYRLSFLFDRIAELLRNDSVIDITQRKELYTEVFTFVQVSPLTGTRLNWDTQ